MAGDFIHNPSQGGGGGNSGSSLTTAQENIINRTGALSKHTVIKVSHVERYRIFATQQEFIQEQVSNNRLGAVAGIYGTPYDVTSTADQTVTLRPVVVDITPSGQTEIIGNNNVGGNGQEVIHEASKSRLSFFNGIWINANIRRWIVLGVAGQSNSVGFGEETANTRYNPVHPRIYQLGRFNGFFNKIIPATHAIHHIDNQTANNGTQAPLNSNADTDIRAGLIGPAKMLAESIIKELPDDVGIIIVGGGNGGTGFSSTRVGTFNNYPAGYNLVRAQLADGVGTSSNEVPYGAQASCEIWGTNTHMFNDFVYRIRLALQLPNSELFGIYWAQGESDADATNINLTTEVGNLVDEFATRMSGNSNQMPNGDTSNIAWYIPSFPLWGQNTANRLAKQEQLRTLAENRHNVYYVDVFDARTNLDDGDGRTGSGDGAIIHFSGRGYRDTVVPRVFSLIKSNPLSQGVFAESKVKQDFVKSLERQGGRLFVTTTNNLTRKDNRSSITIEPSLRDLSRGLILNLEFENTNPLENTGRTESGFTVTVGNEVGTPNATTTNTGRNGKVINLNSSKIISVDTTGFNSSFTFSCYFRTTSVSGSNPNNIFTTAQDGTGTVFWLPQANRIQTMSQFFNPLNTYDLPSGTFINTWYHAMIRWTDLSSTNGRMDLFLNGEMVSTAETSDRPDISQMLIGRYYNIGTTSFIGLIDSVRLYNRAVSNDDAYDIYMIDQTQKQLPFQDTIDTGVNVSNPLQFESTTHYYTVSGNNGGWYASRTNKASDYQVRTISGTNNRPNDIPALENLSW